MKNNLSSAFALLGMRASAPLRAFRRRRARASLGEICMNSKCFVVFALLGAALLGMGGTPPVSIRFHVEANPNDTDVFSSQVHLQNPPRDVFIEKVPDINERMIRAVWPFQTTNGSWGCAFKLDVEGRLALEVLSTNKRGRAIVAMLSTKKHQRVVIDMVIDKPITDGIITIPTGLTELEIAVLTKEFPVIGQKKGKGKTPKATPAPTPVPTPTNQYRSFPTQ
jgi:hypothetical protein